MDVEVLLQENQHQLLTLNNKKNQLQEIESRAQICLREQNLFVERLKTSLNNAGEQIKVSGGQDFLSTTVLVKESRQGVLYSKL